MKKYLTILFLVAFIVPSVALASWWNPFSWGIFSKIFSKNEVVETTQTQPVEINKSSSEENKEQAEDSSEELEEIEKLKREIEELKREQEKNTKTTEIKYVPVPQPTPQPTPVVNTPTPKVEAEQPDDKVDPDNAKIWNKYADKMILATKLKAGMKDELIPCWQTVPYCYDEGLERARQKEGDDTVDEAQESFDQLNTAEKKKAMEIVLTAFPIEIKRIQQGDYNEDFCPRKQFCESMAFYINKAVNQFRLDEDNLKIELSRL